MYMDNLNSEQELSVTTTEGPVRVIAGAGSGKTRALTARYCYLVDELGIAPGSILCATFTRRAANEMRSRIRKELGDMDVGFICTFHAFCVQFLKEEANALNYPKEFLLMDEEDVKDVLLKIFEDMHITSKQMTVKRAAAMLERRKKDAVDYIDNIYLLDNEQLREKFMREKNLEEAIFLRYLYEQKKSFGCDFNDLIGFTVYILENFEEVRDKWQDKMEYVMVDEFQDVSPRQYSIAQLLSGKHHNLFIVGDPDQTIYGWRGSDVNLILQFDKVYPDCRTIVLDTNYRSTPEILKASDTLIAKNTNRYHKTLKSVKEPGQKPLYFHAKTEQEEAEWIYGQIADAVKEGVPYGHFAVLYRAHTLSRVLEEVFIKKKLPYEIYGGVEFYGRKEIKDLISYLRMLVFADDISFRRTITTPPRRIGKKKMEFLAQYAELNQTSLYEALKANYRNDMFASTDASDYIRCIEEGRDSAGDSDLGGLLQRVMDTSGYEEFMRLQGDQERLDNMAELKRSIIEYGEDPDATLGGFLADIALYTDADRTDKADAVKLMTVHTAKGMEFPYVFVVGLDENVFPSSKTETAEQMEEERRLMYVAMTRAMYMLYLTDSEGGQQPTSCRPGSYSTPKGRTWTTWWSWIRNWRSRHAPTPRWRRPGPGGCRPRSRWGRAWSTRCSGTGRSRESTRTPCRIL